MSKVYNKLVRDKIIEIIEAKSEIPTYETLKDDRYLSELHKKLFEEANEFCENFGGGGHSRAAGFSSFDDIFKIKEKIKNVLTLKFGW